MSFSWYVLRKRLGSNGAVMLSTSCFVGHVGVLERLGDVLNLALIVQRHHDQVIVVGDERDGRFRIAQHRRADSDLAFVHHGSSKQFERLLAAGLGYHLVGLLEVERRHLVDVGELHDLHSTIGIGLDGVQLLVVHHYVLALLVLVAFHDVFRFQLSFTVRACLHVSHALHGIFGKLVEPYGVILRRREQLHRDVHETERDCAFPTGHDLLLPRGCFSAS